jgi:hypothetical protein
MSAVSVCRDRSHEKKWKAGYLLSFEPQNTGVERAVKGRRRARGVTRRRRVGGVGLGAIRY